MYRSYEVTLSYQSCSSVKFTMFYFWNLLNVEFLGNVISMLFCLGCIQLTHRTTQYPRRKRLQRILYSIIFSSQSWFPARQGKLFQRCKHLLYCSILSLGGKVSQDGCRSLTWNPFSQKQSIEYSGLRKLLCEFSKLSKVNAVNLLRY